MKKTMKIFCMAILVISAVLSMGAYSQTCFGPPPPAPGSLKWKIQLTDNGEDIHSAAMDGAGNLYFGSDDYKLYSLTPDGKVRWIFSEATSWMNTAVAIGADGTLYAGSWDGDLYAINPDGTKKWSISLGYSIGSSPAIAADGTVYIRTMNEYLYAINPNGIRKWELLAGAPFGMSSPAIDKNGIIYVASSTKKVLAIKDDGTKATVKWEFVSGGMYGSTPAIGPTGNIYLGSDEHKVYAIDATNGSKIWEFTTGWGDPMSPAIGPDGTLFIGCRDNTFYAIDSLTGNQKWAYTDVTIGSVWSTPAVSQDGSIYFGTIGTMEAPGQVYALDKNGNKKWSYVSDFQISASPAIGDDGTVYIGDGDGTFYAISSDGGPLASGTWPKLGKNNQNTHQGS